MSGSATREVRTTRILAATGLTTTCTGPETRAFINPHRQEKARPHNETHSYRLLDPHRALQRLHVLLQLWRNHPPTGRAGLDARSPGLPAVLHRTDLRGQIARGRRHR